MRTLGLLCGRDAPRARRALALLRSSTARRVTRCLLVLTRVSSGWGIGPQRPDCQRIQSGQLQTALTVQWRPDTTVRLADGVNQAFEVSLRTRLPIRASRSSPRSCAGIRFGARTLQSR